MRPSLALKANTDRVIKILSRFNVKNPRIFGSTARAEDDDDSDLDILVEPNEGLTFFDLARTRTRAFGGPRLQGRRDDACRVVGRGRRECGSGHEGVAVKGARPVEGCLRDIIAYGRRLARHLDGVSRSEFLANEMIQDAAAKCVEAIGEAAGQIARLEPDLELRYPDLRLSDAYSARNRLSHGYHSIDYGVLWTTVMRSIPATVEAATIALAARSANNSESGADGRP